MPFKILIADDSDLFRKQLREYLQGESQMAVVGEARNGYEVLSQMLIHQPDLVLMDISMPGLNGLSATLEVKQGWPDTQVIMLTKHTPELYGKSARLCGAAGFVVKKHLVSDLLPAIHKHTKPGPSPA